MRVDRARVMAYRMGALGLAGRTDRRPGDLAVLDLGVQEYTPGSTRVALAARTTADLDDDRLLTVWATRGAPHLHREADLPHLAAALWPVSDADATARIQSAQIPDGMRLGIEAFRVTAEAMRRVVTHSMPRGEVSTAVSKLVPRSLTFDCRVCRARHIAGNVWQHAGLPGGVRVESRGRDAMLGPIERWAGVPDRNIGFGRLIALYLRMLGPATPAEVAKYFGSTATEMKTGWPDGLAEVCVDGRRTWLPETSVNDLVEAEKPAGVRLVPAMDALLQARDRDLLVPEPAHQKQVWRVLGNPGAVVIDGEVAGVWRAKTAGRKRVDLTVTGFRSLTAKQRAAIEAEAGKAVARARGAQSATVTYAG